MEPTLAIVGDSYIWRLEAYLKQLNLSDLSLSPQKVAFFGLGGSSVWGNKPVVKQLEQAMALRSINIIYLHIGSNDLCSPQSAGKTTQLANNMYSLAKYALWGSNASAVVIGQIIPRQKCPHPLYNQLVEETNQQLYKIGLLHEHPISYAYLYGLQNPPKQYYCDLIHLSPRGNKKLYRGIRGAFKRALVSL